MTFMEYLLRTEKIQVAEEEKRILGTLGYFLEGMLKFLGVAQIEKNIKCLTVAMETMDSVQVANLSKGLLVSGAFGR